MMTRLNILILTMIAATTYSAEYHVSTQGNDAYSGTKSRPFKTISKGAEVAQPGDTVIVHEGVYREEINPPRGGTSDKQRIVYRAAKGENVVIKGSEVVKGWTHVEGDVWKLVIENPESFFGAFNPFRTQIYGDWYRHKGRLNHVGQVYLNGHWLSEASSLEEVMKPAGETALWYTNDQRYPTDRYGPSVDLLKLELNGEKAAALNAVDFTDRKGAWTGTHKGDDYIKAAREGHWLKYEEVNFGKKTSQITFTCMTESIGGLIEIRLDSQQGQLLGICPVDYTGSRWTGWREFSADIKETGGIHTLCLVFKDKPEPEPNAEEVIIWAQFKDVNPNEELVEINARETVFYPRKTGINYITVSGFTLEHGSPNWAPPTAEQVGLIGTHWSKGWIIENNTIRYSSCTGITLGKYGDEMDNRAMSAEGYVGTIKRAHTNGWAKGNIGSHIVRNNSVSYCEQAGIVGSMGAAFSRITGNEVFQIHRRGLFSGAEMAGIKFHAAIDTLIADNHVYACNRGLWLDWMTQGTRVSQNLFHGNMSEDLFLEVNHGPCVIDNNLFLSSTSVSDWSQGSAFIHNLIAGNVWVSPQERQTPYHPAHSTELAGLDKIYGGDNRFFNNIFAGRDALINYRKGELPLFTGANLFLNKATPLDPEKDGAVMADFDPQINVVRDGNDAYVEMVFPKVNGLKTEIITTADLGEAAIPKLPYKNYDEADLIVNNDYWGNPRKTKAPSAGPFEDFKPGAVKLKVWPKNKTITK
ncbi:carbohydrate-binding protein [Verrucomicrobia bacterium S94]|nr:carbohydrate-binding protein [Verrucomicrobia bacterium S94]